MSVKYELSGQQIQLESESEDTIQENTESENKNTKEMLTPAQSWGGQLSLAVGRGSTKIEHSRLTGVTEGSLSCTPIT